MAIKSPDRRLEIGDVIYRVKYDPFVNDRPEWFVIPCKIKDMYYTDACYAEIEVKENDETVTKKIILSKDTLEEYYYTLQLAESQANYLNSVPRSYAWGYNNHVIADGGHPCEPEDSSGEDYKLDIINLDDEEDDTKNKKSLFGIFKSLKEYINKF